MRVKEVFPCVCIGSKPDTAVSTYYGMPELRTNGSFWQIRCPRCGRGGLMEFSSQYYALKDEVKEVEKIRRSVKGILRKKRQGAADTAP